jgi:hypothetical protein
VLAPVRVDIIVEQPVVPTPPPGNQTPPPGQGPKP